MGGGSTWKNFCNNLDIIGYFMPLSGHCWDGPEGVQKAIDKSGFKQDEYFIFAATGTKDIAYDNLSGLMRSLRADTQRFTYGCDFSKCNVYYLEAPNETHWWGIVRHYVRTGLPLFFHEHQDD